MLIHKIGHKQGIDLKTQKSKGLTDKIYKDLSEIIDVL